MPVQEQLKQTFEKNRAFFMKGPSRSVNWSKANVGGLCLDRAEHVIMCFAASELQLARRWLDEMRWLIAESKERVEGHQELDLIDLARVYVPLADKLEKLLRDEGIDRAPTTPYEAFDTYLSSETDIEPEDFDCVWLMWALSALLENQRDRYEELLPKLRRKAHRELVRERELVKGTGAVFEGGGDEAFWRLYRDVLMRWLDPVLQTESEAFLYRDPIRYLLALNWMVHKRRSERRDDFLEILYGNV